MGQRRRRIATLAATAIAGLLVVALLAVPRDRPATSQPRPSDGPTPSESADPPLAENPPPDLVGWADAEWAPVEGGLGVGPLFRVDGLIDTGEHLVGWGRVPMPGRNQFNDMGAVFVSVDGPSWRAIAVEHGVNPANASTISGVAAGPNGFLAFGSVCCEPEAPAVWHSPDLAEWTRLPLDGDPGGNRLSFSALAGGPDGWVAVGSTPNGRGGEVWASVDGASWDSVLTVEDGMPGLVVADVAMTADGYIAVGTVTGPDGTYDGAVWTAPDGRDWERVGVEAPVLVGAEETALLSVVPHAGGFYVTGIHGTTEARRACEALGMAAPLEIGPPTTATSCGWGAEHGWVSPDGETWERVDPAQAPGEQPIEFRLIVAGGPGLVLLGESSKPGSPDATLFTSADGRSWTPVAPPLPMGDGTPQALAVRGRQVIAIADHFDGVESLWQIWLATVR